MSSPFGGPTVAKSNTNPRNVYNEGEYIEDSEKRKICNTQWGMIAPNTYKAVSETNKGLPAGAYDISKDERDNSPIFIKKILIHDTIIPLSGLPKQILSEIKDFWEKEELFGKLGFLHRRGYLLYGSHGTGKSSLVHEISENVIKDGGVVFYCTIPDFFNAGLTAFRQVESNRRAVCIFEDIDAMIRVHGESTLLSILDGENQISRVCNIATTNYPELLDKRIVGRPRRFDRVYRIGNLDDKARATFLSKKLPKGADQKSWIKKTQGLSIASISEAIISVFCFGKSIDEAVDIMKNLAEDKSSNDDRGNIGFDKKDECGSQILLEDYNED